MAEEVTEVEVDVSYDHACDGYHEGHDGDCKPLCGEEFFNGWECLHALGVFGMDSDVDCHKCLKLMAESYDKTDLYVYASECQ